MTNDSKEVLLGNRYACLIDKTCFYPKDEYGNEYKPNEFGLIEKNGKYVYPLTPEGKPKYPIDEDGREIYEKIDGQEVIGTGSDGHQYYAVDSLKNEYYPQDNSPALLNDDSPYYATTADGKHTFPVDELGNEYYLSFIDWSKPQSIPDRYAISILDDEIYPIKKTQDGRESQCLLNNKYAVDRDQKPFYPKDGFNNEFYLKPKLTDYEEYLVNGKIENILLDRYALTNDGRIILPQIRNTYYRDSTIEPIVRTDNIIGKLIRDDNIVSDYLTNLSDATSHVQQQVPYKYKTLVTNEIRVVSPKPSPTLNLLGIFNTATATTPFHKRWCFWAFAILVVIVNIFIGWWLFFKKVPNTFIK